VSRPRFRRCTAATILIAAAAAGCGKRGAPLPPLRPVPVRIADATAELAGGRVTLRFTVPNANLDGSSPPGVERVEIYRRVVTPGEPPQPAGQLVQDELRHATIDVRRPDDAAGPGAAAPPAAPLPAPGEPAMFVDPVPPDAAIAAPAAAEWRYVIVGVAGRNRRGPPSPVLAVPIGAGPASPSGVTLSYDETTLRVRWTPAAEAARHRVSAVPAEAPDATGTTATALTPEPIDGVEFTQPVQFGARLCVTVRAVQAKDAVTIVGPPSAPVCETPVDTFAPPAPDRLVAAIDGEAVVLSWGLVTAADLAGYLVLRAEAAGGTLAPLVTAPMADTTFRDTTAVSGTVYTYVVVAVDRAGNRSPASNAQTIRRDARQVSGQR
jgi:hypothetical protein